MEEHTVLQRLSVSAREELESKLWESAAKRDQGEGRDGEAVFAQLRTQRKARRRSALRNVVIEWRNTRAVNLLFSHRDTAILAVVALIGLSFTILVGRALTRKKAGRTQVALPAVLDWSGRNWTALVRHGALLLFLVGLPFFTLALAFCTGSAVATSSRGGA